jgi:hypothetical protein
MSGHEMVPGVDRPWERPGAVRRDCQPHRGHLLGALANLSLALGVLAAVFGVPFLVGLAVSVFTQVLAKRDLARMAAGAMDPRGREQTAAARRRAAYAMVLNLFAPITSALLWGTLVTFFLMDVD